MKEISIANYILSRVNYWQRLLDRGCCSAEAWAVINTLCAILFRMGYYLRMNPTTHHWNIEQ